MKNHKLKLYIFLQFILLIMAFTGVLSKLASMQKFMSLYFIAAYGCMLFLLAIYAIGWQQILKNMDLSVAYANRAFALIYNLLFGFLIFGEKITTTKVFGCILAISGILIYVSDNESEKND